MPYRITTGPVAEPVSLKIVKDWLKLDDISADDDIVLMLMASARDYVERHTGQAMMQQTVEEVMDYWPVRTGELTLALAPVASITSIQYRNDTDGTYTTWNSDEYEIDLVGKPARVWLGPESTWPTLGNYPNAVKITYVAGHASAATVPLNLKKAMCAQVCLDYCNREGYTVEAGKYLNAVDMVIRMERVIHA